ncbi:dihydrofolate reductase family protein [Microbispora sp. NBRC 16548]|uniref:dihydrofolate reductase family protein n=1 Tax=Microbispora sp. NBRC 16548 TaxID=3030994 RepID=UPI0024A41FF4|nr:dihydrofolate reductase family protein [Microbispora sp. NBRC 16548]GLX06856.1 deaminase [Microbispora sp. NBRC 16548]
MATMLYSATMSLDGFIAGPGGDMSWLTEHLGPNPTVDALVGDIGALLVGNRTFRGDDPYRDTPQEGEPFGGGWSGPQFVLTHDVPAAPVPGVTFVTDFGAAVADVAAQCLDAGLLDEILVCVAPVMLGDGVRLFSHPGGDRVRLERISLTHVPHATNIWMRVVR